MKALLGLVILCLVFAGGCSQRPTRPVVILYRSPPPPPPSPRIVYGYTHMLVPIDDVVVIKEN